MKKRKGIQLKKILAAAMVVTMFTGIFTGCGKAKKNSLEKKNIPETVNIGVQTLITPELISRYEKVYDKYLGTKVNLIQFDSGADVNKAFSSGSVDIASFGTAPASIGISENLGYEVFWYYDVIGSAESLVAAKGSGITDIKSLKGKKVATPFASTAHYSLLNAMKLEGVSPSDVELLDMQPNAIYAAWERGDIDAAYVWNPVLAKLKNKDGIIITDSAQLARKGIVTADVAAVRKDFAKKYPKVVVNYVKSQLAAIDEYKNKQDEAIEKIAKTAGITKNDAKFQVKTFSYPDGNEQVKDDYLGTKESKGKLADTLKATADFLKEQGSIDKSPDLQIFKDNITGEFVEKALKE